MMRKRFIAAVLVALLLLLGSSAAYAAEKGISSICVWAELNADGSADIKEIWEIDDVFKGTEYYKALNNVGENAVSNLTVSDDRGVVYTTLDRWNVDASFEEKANKCGIHVTDKGYELCWGISELGDRTYTISYHLDGLVKHYSDKDGFYYQFISDKLSSAPEFAQVVITMKDAKLTNSNSEYYAFGYKGDLDLISNELIAVSREPFKKRDNIKLLVGLEHGLIDAPLQEGTFEALKEKAIHGDQINGRVVASVVAVVAAIFAAIFYWIRKWYKYIMLADGTKLLRVKAKDVELNRRPVHGDSLAVTHVLMKLGSPVGEVGTPISGYLLHWGMTGAAQLKEDGKKPTLILNNEPGGEAPEIALYDMFLEASGGEGNLPLKQWEKWIGKNPHALEDWQKAFEAHGEKRLQEEGWAKENEKGKLRLTRAGYEKYAEVLGYKKYLTQIANLEAENVAEADWNRALIFAAYFGLAGEIAPGFERLSQEHFGDGGLDYMSYSYFLLSTRIGRSFSTTAANSGGSSFAGGGGGFSGGGGGGSR